MAKESGSQVGQQGSIEGIGALPKQWAVAVRLISTYGLALFLVLYYLFIIRPEDSVRYENLDVSYDKLNRSMASLAQAVQERQTFITLEQTSHLNSLYVATVTNELDNAIYQELRMDTSIENLEKIIRQKMLQHAEPLKGFVMKNGFSIFEEFHKRIWDINGFCKRIAEDATKEWKDLPLHTVNEKLELALIQSFASGSLQTENTVGKSLQSRHAARVASK